MRELFKDEFDPKMNWDGRIKLKNEDKTACNSLSWFDYGIICGKQIYSSGKHEIKIRIDQFPNSKNEFNQINLGVIKTENREKLISNDNWEGTYYFQANWDKNKLQTRKFIKENGKCTQTIYPEEINLKKTTFLLFLLIWIKKNIFQNQ